VKNHKIKKRFGKATKKWNNSLNDSLDCGQFIEVAEFHQKFGQFIIEKKFLDVDGKKVLKVYCANCSCYHYFKYGTLLNY
jgi:hypothetical protein